MTSLRAFLLAGLAAALILPAVATAQEAGGNNPLAQPPAEAPAAPAPYTPPAQTPAVTSEPATRDAPPADPLAQQTAETLPTQIEDVQVVGPWMDNGQSGVWRTVMQQVGIDKETYRFFVQKLDKVGPGGKVISTTEIKEVASVDGAVVGYRADEPEEGNTGDLTLFFDIVPSTGEVAETYELHFMRDNTYKFGPASN